MSSRQRWLVLTLAALLGIVLTALLGRWQLSRADMRERVQSAIDIKRQMPAFETPAVLALPSDYSDTVIAQALHRVAHVRGQWLTQHTVFLDNRQMFGRPGFYVLTPLQLDGSSRVLMVQRGWIPRNFVDRLQLPTVSASAGLVDVYGRLAGPPARLLELGSIAEPESGAQRSAASPSKSLASIRQNLDLKAFAQETNLALMPFTLMQTDSPAGVPVALSSDGLQREWPLVNSGASKNYGYAAQWFALSVLIAGLYGWFQFGKSYVAKHRS